MGKPKEIKNVPLTDEDYNAMIQRGIEKSNRGAKQIYTTSHVAICRSVPKGMIPALDKWLEQERQKHLIPIDDDGKRIMP